MKFQIPETIEINELVYYARDQDTPAKMCAYLQMLKDLQSYDSNIIA